MKLLSNGLIAIFLIFWFTGCNPQKKQAPVSKEVQVNFDKGLLKIDGFGVNITPAQWNNGKLKPAIDRLTDELGATLFRFDCVGLANWLDPAKRQPNGEWTNAYLDSVYRSSIFSDAWQTFRYLNQKGIEPFFNVSGRIRPGLGKKDDPNRLADFDGYAEMVISMLTWAREKEGLKFSLLAPFNETDLGFPEGPAIYGKDMLVATKAVINKLDIHGLSDIKLIAIDDNNPGSISKLNAVLSDPTIANRVYAFATHTYGDGDISDANDGDFQQFTKAIRNSAFKGASSWLTEYGDLDQTGEIEYEFAWRSTRRLMKRLDNGFNAALAWDAFDNFHEHDTVWAVYGLLETDKANWIYTPKKRFYAAKQIYRYVRPGWKMVEINTPQPTKYDIYKFWHDSFRHIRLQAFVSPDGNDYTIVIMNGIESDVDLCLKLNNPENGALSKTLNHFVTDKTDNCQFKKRVNAKNETIQVLLPEHSISTITTLK